MSVAGDGLGLAPVIRSRAASLRRLLVVVEELKVYRPKPEELRPMRPTFGSRSPGNAAVTDRSLTVEIRLREWCRYLRDDLVPGFALGDDAAGWCRFVEEYSTDIAAHGEAAEFVVALEAFERDLAVVVDGPGREPERRVSVRSAALKAGVSYDTVRGMIRAGHVSSAKDDRGRHMVLMSELRAYLAEKG